MPEGDTIHRSANRLRPVLVDRPLVAAELPRVARPAPPAGTVVTAVRARGKHLLVHFDTGEVLHTHMRMTGSWHTYPAGARWQRPRRRMRALLANDRAQAVCFDAPVVDLVDEQALPRIPSLATLGPDLLVVDDAVAGAMRRVRAQGVGAGPIVDLLLDQRVAAGIGNVYANEVCFLAGVDPRSPADRVDLADVEAMYGDAARLLRANLSRANRTTVPGGRPGAMWVYGRGGQPCRRCGTTLASGRVGSGARPTAWCPACQPPTLLDHLARATRAGSS